MDERSGGPDEHGPTHYDVLGVRRDASPEEVKAAWQQAVARFEPGSGTSQFRLFNTAAEVLLDPERRAAYDATLAPEPAPERAPESAAERAAEQAPTPAPAAAASEHVPGQRSRLVIPGWVIVALTVVTGVAVGVAAFLAYQAHVDSATAQAESRAPRVAEAAASSVLSYDYRTLAQDKQAAARLMTPQYRDQYLDTFDGVVVSGAKQTKARVRADVQAAAVTRATPDRVEVLLFVDQVTVSTANNGQPQTALNRVRFSMVRSGESWLVDDITSY